MGTIMESGILEADEKMNLIFRQLRIVSCNFFADPTQENLNILQKISESMQPEVLGKLLFYIFVPFCAHMSESEKKICSMLEGFTKIVEKSKLTDLSTFVNLYSTIFKKIQDFNNSSPGSSEEVKLKAVLCISQLLKSSSPDILVSFVSREYYSKLSIGVYTCLLIASNEEFLSLRLEALKCLMLLTQVSDDISFQENYENKLGDVFMYMVPGVSSKCLKIFNDSETQNHKPLLLALKIWSRITALALSNPSSGDDIPIKFSLQGSNSEKEDHQFRNEIQLSENGTPTEIIRDWTWIKKTDGNLEPMMKLIVKLQAHQVWKVRLELAKSSFHLLEHCGANMSCSAGYLVEILALLSQDHHPEVSKFSKESILTLSKKFNTLSGHKLVDVVKENLYSLLTRLPRIIRGTDITKKEKELTLLCGLVDILGRNHLPLVLGTVHHLNRFLHSLLVCATPSCTGITLLEEAALRGVDSNYHFSDAKWRHLSYCDSPKCEAALRTLCGKMVEYSDFEILINILLDEFNMGSKYRRSVLVLFIFMFSSGSTGDFQKYSSLRDVVSTIMDQSLWNVPVQFNDGDVESRITIQENIIQVCLLTELVGCLSTAAGLETFSPLLLECLYPVIESAGSPLSIISAAGQISLRLLAKLYEEGEVGSLIQNNVDYLSHHVMLKLRQAHRNPRVLSVLSVIMDHTSLSTLPSLHDIINDVLIQSCDSFQDINASAYLQVFHTYLSCIKKWTVQPPKSSQPKQDKMDIFVKEVTNYFDALEKAAVAENEPIEDFNDPGDFMSTEETIDEKSEDVKPKLPNHIQLTLDILKRSLNFLPANNMTRQIFVLEILNFGIEILSPWENELLPVVHKIWSPLVERFKASSHPLLLQRAFSLLMTLAKYSKDFIRSRTSKSVLPVLLKVLRSSSAESKKPDSTGAYRLTQLYKLQLLLLTNLGKLSEDLMLDFKDAYSIISAASPYLSNSQPKPLQEAVSSLYLEISKSYSDIVWAHLMTICPNHSELKAPCDGLQDYQFEKSNLINQEFPAAIEIFNKIQKSDLNYP